MESQRIGPALLFLLFCAGVISAIYYFKRVDEANDAFLDARKVHEVTLQQLGEKQRQQHDIQEKLDLQNEIEKGRSLIEQRATELAKLHRSVEADLKYLSTAVAKARNQKAALSQSQPIPTFVLRNGTTLANAKITRAEGSAITVVHSDGISQVDFGDFPEGLVEEFDLGPDSIQAQLEALQQEVGLAPNVGKSQLQAQARGYARKIQQLESAHERAWHYCKKLEAEVARYNADIKEAEETGQPTFRLRSARDVAQGSAGNARRQVSELEKELLRARAAAAELKNGS